MKDLTTRVFVVSVKLMLLAGVTAWLLLAGGIEWGIYLIPLNVLLLVYVLLSEVDSMIGEKEPSVESA